MLQHFWCLQLRGTASKNPWSYTRGQTHRHHRRLSWEGLASVWKGDRRTDGDHGSYFIDRGGTGRPWQRFFMLTRLSFRVTPKHKCSKCGATWRYFGPVRCVCAPKRVWRCQCAMDLLRNGPKSGAEMLYRFLALGAMLSLHHHQFLSSGWAQVLRKRPTSPPSAVTDVKYSLGLFGVVGIDRWKRPRLPHLAHCGEHWDYCRASNVAKKNVNI